MTLEHGFDIPFVASQAQREKHIQQVYRPCVAVHKWFARRPGSLFRSLVLAEFADTPLADSVAGRASVICRLASRRCRCRSAPSRPEHLAHPVPGLGIALPVFVPGLSAGIVALLLSRRYAAALAYIGGSLGTLIGADLTNLGAVQGPGAPVASIGGAGTFDGIFLNGVMAVIIASLGSAV